MLVQLYDLNNKGSLDYNELQQLCKDMQATFTMFRKHDRTASQTLSMAELRAALAEAGIHTHQSILEMLINRYGSLMTIVVLDEPVREVCFPNFVLCLRRLAKAIIYWLVKYQLSVGEGSPTNTINRRAQEFTLVEYMKQVINF